MKNNINFLYKLNFIIVLISIFCWSRTMAQSGNKSNLTLSDPVSKKQVNDFVPDSKYGLVVTFSNLSEALKNPTAYKSARFTNSNLTDFPEQIFLFPNLIEIDVSHNAITKLPLRLNELKNLKDLYVGKNHLISLGDEITSCGNLEVIKIQDNPLKSISKEIGKLTALRELTIGQISPDCVIPVELWNLTNLTKLIITHANLSEIPPTISGLNHLTELSLENNSISEVPEELYSLKNIKSLNLGHNKIKFLSPSIKALENINYLGIYCNPLIKFPEEIGSLKMLLSIGCWNTNIPSREIEKVRSMLPQAKIRDIEKNIH